MRTFEQGSERSKGKVRRKKKDSNLAKLQRQVASMSNEQISRMIEDSTKSFTNGQDATGKNIYTNTIQQESRIWPKLEISQPEDQSEKQADKVAEGVTKGDVNISRMALDQTPSDINAKSEDTGMSTTPDFDQQLQSTKGQGSKLEGTVQREMESHLGSDLSGVNIHTGGDAQQMSADINAKAFAHGQDVYFNEGQYNPSSEQGKGLLAHELTHTVQQGNEVHRQVQQQPTTGGSILPDFPAIAKTIHKELEATNTDEELIFSELKKLLNSPIYIQCLTESYRNLYHVSISAALQGELDSDEVPKAMELLIPSHATNQKYIRGEWMELKTYSKATTFKDLVILIRVAEDILIANGYYAMFDRLKILRGIFYGTTWSMDYDQEKSAIRNAGFDVYTASVSRPVNPIKMLGEELFNAIKQTTEITDGGRQVDVGHLLIGLESRSNFSSREVDIPGQGGTGLEAVTWLGDIGGGVGMTAMKRADGTQSKAKSVVFNATGHDYGSSVNLEGDIAAYIIARDSSETDDPSYPKMDEYSYISDAIADYLLLKNGKTSSEWDKRVKNFAMMIGAEFDVSNNMTNKDDFIEDMSEKFVAFGDTYAFARLTSHKQLTKEKALNTAKNLKGTSDEVAKIFADMLERCAKDPSKKLVAVLDPAITPAGIPASGLLLNFYTSAVLAEKVKNSFGK
jgi:hypothetical protein